MGIKPSIVHSGGVDEGDLRSYPPPPLLIDSGKSSPINKPPMFKFELGWLLRDVFVDMVSGVWNSVADQDDKMRCWQSKIRRLC
jgi:hypothetical protein